MYYQLPVYSEISFGEYKIPAKIMIDILLVNDTKKDIVIMENLVIPPNHLLEIDLKTTSKYAYEFEETIKKWRYDIQRAFYKLILSTSKEFNKYTHLEPCMVVNSFLEPEYPQLYQMGLEDMYIALEGDSDKGILGINQLLERFVYFKNNGYNYDMNESPHLTTTNLWE